MTTSFDVEVAQELSMATIALAGQVDRSAMTALMSAYERAAAADPRTVLLDFTAVDYINSTGIALVVSVLARARAEGRVVLACGLTEHYRHIFSITRLTDFIEIFPDAESATHGALARPTPPGA